MQYVCNAFESSVVKENAKGIRVVGISDHIYVYSQSYLISQ